ncbi:MAG: hypothetical protein DRH37_03495 [Deltaproteobacteria bacterium]|nr:MAG: hypothetical protein DRH37_03495 [Deltaproteobacteria bacterium]
MKNRDRFRLCGNTDSAGSLKTDRTDIALPGVYRSNIRRALKNDRFCAKSSRRSSPLISGGKATIITPL